MPRSAIKLSPEEDRAFQKFIEENSGLHLEEHAIRSLAEAVGERIKATKVESPYKYLNFLRFHPQGKEEFPQLLNLLTIKETYFFRNQPQFKVLKEKILPEIVKRKTKGKGLYHPQLRLWSAGCSSGEEPYSLAMSIREVIPNPKDWEIEILATDISPEALEKGERGVYAKRAVKYTDKVYLDKYFKRSEGKYYLKDEIRGMVKFLYHNLVNDLFPENLDLIFCRNVTIYFKRPLTEKIIEKFYQSLNEGGYLIIGHSETLYGMSSGFELVNLGDAFVYRKVNLVGGARAVRESISKGVELKERVKEQRAGRHLPPRILSFPRADSPSPAGLAVGERRPTDVPFDAEASFGQALSYYQKRDYLKALEFCQKALPKLPNPARAYHLLGCIYADQGEYKKSAEPLEKALKYDSLLFDAYFRLGIVYIKLEKPKEAIASLKKTVFLNPNFALAHFYLANLYRDFKEDNKALREYENALKALNSNSKADLGEFGGGFAKETLTRTCQIYLERLRKKRAKV